MTHLIWRRSALLVALAEAAGSRVALDESVVAVGTGATDVGVQADLGLGLWWFALPLTLFQHRRRLAALSKELGWSQPLCVGVVVTARRLMLYRCRTLARPVLVAEVPLATIEGVHRPTVGGYLRTLKVDLSEDRSLTLSLFGDEADVVAAALGPTTAAA